MGSQCSLNRISTTRHTTQWNVGQNTSCPWKRKPHHVMPGGKRRTQRALMSSYSHSYGSWYNSSVQSSLTNSIFSIVEAHNAIEGLIQVITAQLLKHPVFLQSFALNVSEASCSPVQTRWDLHVEVGSFGYYHWFSMILVPSQPAERTTKQCKLPCWKIPWFSKNMSSTYQWQQHNDGTLLS